MLTARGRGAGLVKAPGLGADDYLTKPFSPEDAAGARQGVAAAGQSRAQARAPLAAGRVALDPRELPHAHRRRSDPSASPSSSCGCCRCCWRRRAARSTPTGCWYRCGGIAAPVTGELLKQLVHRITAQDRGKLLPGFPNSADRAAERLQTRGQELSRMGKVGKMGTFLFPQRRLARPGIGVGPYARKIGMSPFSPPFPSTAVIWSKMPPVSKCCFCASFQPPK